MKINPGYFKDKTYIKEVDFSKAVLWKDKQISLNAFVTRNFKPRGIDTIIFRDKKKGEEWTASVDSLRGNSIFKQEGQEPQWYFPIELFTVTKISKARPVVIGRYEGYEVLVRTTDKVVISALQKHLRAIGGTN